MPVIFCVGCLLNMYAAYIRLKIQASTSSFTFA